MRITVLKSTGKKQAFTPSKIEHTARAAGAGAQLARLVARSVAKDIAEDLEHFSNQLVPSSLIKSKVVRFLRLGAPSVALRYERYRKPKWR